MNKIKFTKKIAAIMAASMLAVTGVGAGIAATTSAPTAQALEAPMGSIMLDTAQYTLAPGNQYTIGAFITDPNGNRLSAIEVKSLVDTGKLKVSDSRTGSIIDLKQLSTGHFQITAKNEGSCYVVYDIGGTHASVRVDVKKGVKQAGSAVRNTSIFTQPVFDANYSQNNSQGLKYEMKEYEFKAKNGKGTIKIEYPYFLGNSDLEKTLNKKYQELYNDSKKIERVIGTSEYAISQDLNTVEYNENGIISILHWEYHNDGGSGVKEYSAKTYDIKTGKELTYKDILTGSDVDNALLNRMKFLEQNGKLKLENLKGEDFHLNKDGLAVHISYPYVLVTAFPFTSEDTYKISVDSFGVKLSNNQEKFIDLDAISGISGFDSNYSGKGIFTMDSKLYTDGYLARTGRNNYGGGEMAFELDGKYDTLEFDLGYVSEDGKVHDNSTFELRFVLDNNKVSKTVTAKNTDKVAHCVVDVKGTKYLKIEKDQSGVATFGIANMILNKSATPTTFNNNSSSSAVPTSDELSQFIGEQKAIEIATGVDISKLDSNSESYNREGQKTKVQFYESNLDMGEYYANSTDLEILFIDKNVELIKGLEDSNPQHGQYVNTDHWVYRVSYVQYGWWNTGYIDATNGEYLTHHASS